MRSSRKALIALAILIILGGGVASIVYFAYLRPKQITAEVCRDLSENGYSLFWFTIESGGPQPRSPAQFDWQANKWTTIGNRRYDTRELSFTEDAQSIAYVGRAHKSPREGIVRVSLDTGERTVIPFPENDFRFRGLTISPSGRKAAVCGWPDDTPDRVERIFIADFADKTLKEVPSTAGLCGGSFPPQWSQDESLLVFANHGNEISVLELASGLTRTVGAGTSPSWKATTQEISFVRDKTAYCMTRDGTNIRELFHDDHLYEPLSWSPDDKYVVYAFSSSHFGAPELMRIRRMKDGAQTLLVRAPFHTGNQPARWTRR